MLKIVRLFNKSQKKYFFGIISLICIVSILEMANLAIIVPILNSFLDIETSTKEQSLIWFTNLLGQNNNSIQIFLILFLTFFILKTLFSIFVSWKYHNFIFNFIENLSYNLYSKFCVSSFT